MSAPTGSIKVAVTSYQLGFTSQTQSAQFRLGLQHYPIKSLQNDFIFSAQFRSEEALRQAQDFVQKANDQVLNPLGGGPAGAPIRFYWPEMGLDYKGFVKSFPLGSKKFDYAPIVQFQMVLCQDSIYTQTLDYTDIGDWKNVYGDYVNVQQATQVGTAQADFTPPAQYYTQPLSGPGGAASTPAPPPAPTSPNTGGGGVFGWFSSLFG